MLVASLLFVSLDTVAKYLTATYPVEQIVWARFSFHLLVALIIMSPQGFGRLKSNRPWLQVLRSAFMLGANAFFFLALQSIPLVTASAVVFVGPLIVTALSVPLLGERVGPRRWAAVAVGFVGAMLIIRPGTDFMHAATVLPPRCALIFVLSDLHTRLGEPRRSDDDADVHSHSRLGCDDSDRSLGLDNSGHGRLDSDDRGGNFWRARAMGTHQGHFRSPS